MSKLDRYAECNNCGRISTSPDGGKTLRTQRFCPQCNEKMPFHIVIGQYTKIPGVWYRPDTWGCVRFERFVNVTAEHIRRGVPRSSTTGPIALAMASAGLEWANSTVQFLTWVHPTFTLGRQYLITPSPVRQFIADFDGGFPVEPFSFLLREE